MKEVKINSKELNARCKIKSSVKRISFYLNETKMDQIKYY